MDKTWHKRKGGIVWDRTWHEERIRDSYRSYWLIDDPISVDIVVVQTALDKPWLTI